MDVNPSRVFHWQNPRVPVAQNVPGLRVNYFFLLLLAVCLFTFASVNGYSERRRQMANVALCGGSFLYNLKLQGQFNQLQASCCILVDL